MERVCFIFGLYPGKEVEYERRHDEIWLEMLDLLQDAGFRDYSIFLHGSTLYAFLKADPDWETVLRSVEGSDAQRRWAEYMDDLIEWQIDANGQFTTAREVFRFAGEISEPDASPDAERRSLSSAVASAFSTMKGELKVDPGRASVLLGGDRSLVDGAVALVTGAGGEIGGAIALELMSAGANVVLADLDYQAATENAKRLSGRGAASATAVDVTDQASVDALVAEVVRQHGRIDILVNNAGALYAESLLDMPLAEWNRVFSVNATGTFLTTQAVARQMVAQPEHESLGRRGLVACVSSLAAEIGRPLVSGYGASKAAVNHFAKTCAVTLGDHDVSTFVAYPGTVRSKLWDDGARRMADLEGTSLDAVESARTFQPSEEFAEIVVDAIATPGLRLNNHIVQWTRHVRPL